MPRLSLGLGVSSSSKLPSAAAPSGIEVATTASVTVAGFTGGNTTYNGTYTKGTIGVVDPTITTPPTDGEVYIKGIESFVLLPPSVTIGGNNYYDGNDYPYSFEPQGNWTISRMSDDGEGATSLLVIATNASSNNDYIPTSGWSPPITITAAPSGIPTATANSIILQSGGSGFPTFIEDGATFQKQNIGRFGDYGDYKLVWSGTRWEMLGDNNGITFYNTTPSQTTNYFPDQGNWFNFFDQPASLVFVGT